MSTINFWPDQIMVICITFFQIKNVTHFNDNRVSTNYVVLPLSVYLSESHVTFPYGKYVITFQ